MNFRERVLKVKGPRVHKIRGSFGVYDSYKHLRKNKWKGLEDKIDTHTYYRIIKTVNNKIAKMLSLGLDVTLPHLMGRIEIRKYKADIKMVNGKIITNLPIDWNRTLNLWLEDEEAYKERTLVKMEEKEIFKVYYNRSHATYINKGYFAFLPNRLLKKNLKHNIKEGIIDAYILKQ